MQAFIEPDLQTAQIRIHNSYNPFSGFLHPTYILKSKHVPDVDAIRAQLQASLLPLKCCLQLSYRPAFLTPHSNRSALLLTTTHKETKLLHITRVQTQALAHSLPPTLSSSGSLPAPTTSSPSADDAQALAAQALAADDDDAPPPPPAADGDGGGAAATAAAAAPAAVVTETVDRDFADIYLLPPGEDPETCTTWLRMRNRDGRYSLMFEEWMTDDPFIISPRITFEVRHEGGGCSSPGRGTSCGGGFAGGGGSAVARRVDVCQPLWAWPRRQRTHP